MSERLESLLISGITRCGVDIDPLTRRKLLDYLALLVKWNQTYNLTAVRDPESMLTRHLLDSLSIVPYIHGPRVLDAGTGPGLPGIPLALCAPSLRVVLLDSNGKKVRFLTQAKMALGLDNVEVYYGRAEHCPLSGFDQIVSRAFSSLTNMVTWTGHLLQPQGEFVAMKGQYPQAEIDELPQGYEVKATHRLDVPGCEGERHLIIISPSQ